MKTIRIVAPHFVAGVCVVAGIVSRTAPILHYMRGWTEGRVIDYCHQKFWKSEVADAPNETDPMAVYDQHISLR